MQVVDVRGLKIGDGHPVLIAGPCMAESKSLCRQVAEEMARICSVLSVQYIFKASFDKANRSGAGSDRGVGIDDGLEILQAVKDEFDVPVTTDIHVPGQATVAAEVVDLLQIPAFLCRQTDLLDACAATRRPVNVKKGQFLAPHDTKNIVEKLRTAEASGIMLTERGVSFGYNNLVVDMAGLPVMRSFGVPVCFDATHSAQRPGSGGDRSRGNREAIPHLTAAAVAVGIDALFMEVHPDPDRALSDAATQWPLDEAEPLIRRSMRIWKVAGEAEISV
jgi:2-dehydro-3-deoxyphosphooctonate aldolase (KDO 8-P synthase)